MKYTFRYIVFISCLLYFITIVPLFSQLRMQSVQDHNMKHEYDNDVNNDNIVNNDVTNDVKYYNVDWYDCDCDCSFDFDFDYGYLDECG